MAAAYGRIIEAGVHRAPSIKVAEAAKVIENTQRDLNIALMNELAMIFDRLGIRTARRARRGRHQVELPALHPGPGGRSLHRRRPVLPHRARRSSWATSRRSSSPAAASTTAWASTSRTTLVKLLIDGDVPVKGARVGILGLTFKENVSDLRNSRVPDIIRSLSSFAVETLAHDPLASPEDARQEYGVDLVPMEEMRNLEAIILAVPHAAYMATPVADLTARLRPGGILMDVKSVLEPADVSSGVRYWSL